MPTAVWGTEFPLVPFMNYTIQQYQIVANTMETVVNADGQDYSLNTGQYLHIYVNTPAMLTSNFPVELVQIGDHVCYH